MAGLRGICKAYGRMTINGVLWLWDYENDEPVKADEMPIDSDRWRASELARARLFVDAAIRYGGSA